MHIIAEDSIGARLDQFLAAQLPELSRARIQALIKAGDVTVNGKTTKAKEQKIEAEQRRLKEEADRERAAAQANNK